jgi:site-specific DNA-cytosine methylase
LQRHIEASGKARKGVAADAEGGARGGCWWDGSDCAGTLTKQNANGAQRMPDKDNFGAVLQPIGATDVSDSLVARNNQTTGFHTDVVATPTAYRWQNDRDGLQQDDAVAALRASAGSSGFHEMNHPVVVAHAFYSTGGTHGVNQHPEVSPAVKVGSGLGIPSPPAVAQAMTVRRLTARECERLQAFPDDYTLIPWRKKQAEDCPDGPRYKALGNSMACHCMAWIGERIAAYEATP